MTNQPDCNSLRARTQSTSNWEKTSFAKQLSLRTKSSTALPKSELTSIAEGDTSKLDEPTSRPWLGTLDPVWGIDPSAETSLTTPRGAGNLVAHWASFVIASSAMTGVMQMNSVCARRLAKLETFPGDEELGFDKPSADAVRSVRAILTKVYASNPQLEPPAISPAPDGEVIISWRRAEKFMVLSFTEGSKFEWAFRKAKHKLYGTANASAAGTGEALAQVLTYLLNDLWADRKIEQRRWVAKKVGAAEGTPTPQVTAE